jgi:hypothetical protein
MSYSCTDFADDIFNELGKLGAITPAEFHAPDLMDNAQLQANYALRGIDRLVAVRDVARGYRLRLLAVLAEKGLDVQGFDQNLSEIDARLSAALEVFSSE